MFRFWLALFTCLLWLGPPVLAGTSAELDVGINAEAEIGVAPISAPCGLEGGDQVVLLVAARNMVNVSQVLIDFGWRPAGAVTGVTGVPTGGAQQKGFVVPGPPEMEGDWAQFGMAAFTDSLEGESELARFAFELAPHIDSETEVDIWIEEVSLGPSFTERDIIRPIQAMVASNYCDGGEQILAPAAVVSPEQAALPFSRTPRGQVADGSAGELLLSARVFREGSFLGDQEFVWTIDNQGASPLYVLAAEQVIQVDPGGSQQGFSRSDMQGDAHILLDAERGAESGDGEARVEVCSDAGGAPVCAVAVVIWHADATAVERAGTVLPQQLGLGQNYPNPFNAATVIPFTVPERTVGRLRLDILNLAGQVVQTLMHATVSSGRHQVAWDGRDREGRALGSGVYLCRLRLGGEETVRPLVLLR